MSRASNHALVNRRRQIASDEQRASYSETKQRLKDQSAAIIKGMGKAGQGPRAPLKRIQPNSPEGRAIASRYAKPP